MDKSIMIAITEWESVNVIAVEETSERVKGKDDS